MIDGVTRISLQLLADELRLLIPAIVLVLLICGAVVLTYLLTKRNRDTYWERYLSIHHDDVTKENFQRLMASERDLKREVTRLERENDKLRTILKGGLALSHKVNEILQGGNL